MTDPASIDKYHFYDSIFIAVDAESLCGAFVSSRYGRVRVSERRQELLEIARICSKVPYEPKPKRLLKLFSSSGLIQCIFTD